VTSDRQKALALLFCVSVLWILGGILVKLIEWHPVAIAGARSAIAALVLLIYLGRPRFRWSWAEVGGALAYASTVILFVMATKWTTAANAILLQYSAPIYVAIFGTWFLGERATRSDWFSMLAVLGGLALFFFDALATGNWLGNVCGMMSGVAMAWMILFLRHSRNESPLETLLLGNVVSAVIGLPFMFSVAPSTRSWIGLILLGVVQLGIPYIMYAYAIKRVTAVEASIIPAIEAILNPVWVLVILSESPQPIALAGGLIVLGAVILHGTRAAARPAMIS
jgi:drug/metabolite transporter (DMT)-like permease